MGLGSHHLLSDCGKMKFFLFFLLLLLPFDSPQASSLPHIRKARGLNTTLQTHFDGTYQRRNPCTNAEIETSSYVASHEFHHHTKEDNWSDYTHKCSAIISSFLQAIGNLVRFNNKQNGIFNFHINTSISQRQDGQHGPGKACNDMPTIIIEATDCQITPRTHENVGHVEKSEGCVCPNAGSAAHGGQKLAKIISKSPIIQPDEKSVQGKANKCPEAEETLEKGEDMYTTTDTSLATIDPFVPFFEGLPGENLTTEDSSLAVPNDCSQYSQTYEPLPDIFEPSTTPLPDTTAVPELTPGYEKVPTSYKPSQPLKKQPKAIESFNEGSNFSPPIRTPKVPYYPTQPSVIGFGTTSQPAVSVSNVEQINHNQYPPALVNEQPPVVYSEQLSNDSLNGQVPDSLLGESSPNSPPHQVPNLLPPTEPKFEGNRQVGPLGSPTLEGAKFPLTSVIPNEFAPPMAFQPAGEFPLANTPSGTPMPNPFPLQQTDVATTTPYQPPTFQPDRRFPEIAVTIPPQVQRFSPSVRQSFGEDGKSRTLHISMSYPTPPTPINNDAVVPLTPIPDMTPNFENNFRTVEEQISGTSPIPAPSIGSIAPPGKLPTPNIGGQVPSLGTDLSRDSNQFLSNIAPGLQPPYPNPDLSFLTPESQQKLPPPEQPPVVLPPESINPQQGIPNSDSLTTSPVVTPVLPPIPGSAGFIPQNKPFQQETALPPPPQQNAGFQPSPDSQFPLPIQPVPNTFIQPESGDVPPPAERPVGQIYPPQQSPPVNAVPLQPVPTQPLPTQPPLLDYAGQPITQPGPDAFQKIVPVDVTPPHFPPPNPSVVTQTTEVVSQINYPISVRNPDPSASGSFSGNNIGNQLNELTTNNKPVVNSNDFQPKTEPSFMESSDSNLDYTTQTPFYDSIPIANKNEPESQLGLIPKIQDSPVGRPTAPPTGLAFPPSDLENIPATLPPFKPVTDNVTTGQLYTEKPNPDFEVPPTIPQFFNPPGMGWQGPLPATPRPGLPFRPPVQTPNNVPPAINQPNSDQLITNGASLDNNPVAPVQSQTPFYPNQNGGVGQPLSGFPRQIFDQTTAVQPGEFRSGPPNVGPIPNLPVDVVPSNLENRPPFDSQPNAAPVLTDTEEVSRETIAPTGGNLLDTQPFVNPGATLPPGFNTPATFNTKPYIPSESSAYQTQIVSEEFSPQLFTTPMPLPPLQADRPQEILQPDLAPSPPSGPPQFQSAPFPDGNQPLPQESFNGRFFQSSRQPGNQPFNAAPSYPEKAILNKEFNPQFLRNENQSYFASELEPRIIESQNPAKPPQNFLTRPNEEQIPPFPMNQSPSDLPPIPESPVPFLTPEVASPQEPRPSTHSDNMSPKTKFLTNEMDKLKLDADQSAIAGQPELRNLNQLPAIVPPQFTSQSYGGAGTAKTDYPQPYQPQPSPPQPQPISPAQIPTQRNPTTTPPFDRTMDALRPPPQYLQENAADFPPVLVPQPQPQPPTDNSTEIPGDNKADIVTLSQSQTLLPSDIRPVPFAPQPPPQTTYTDTNIQDTVSTKTVNTQAEFENLNNLRSAPNQNFDARMSVNYPPQDRPRPPYLFTDNLRPDDLTSQTSSTFPAGVNPAGVMMNSNEPPYLSTDMPPNEPLETALIDTASPQPQLATAAKYDEGIITRRQSSPALNPQPQVALKYPGQLSEDNIKGELLDSVASASPIPQLPLGLPPNQQSALPMPQLPPQPTPEFSDVNKYQLPFPVQPQFMRRNEMNAQFDAGVKAQEQNVGEIQSANTPPQMFPASQVNAPENPAFNYGQLPTKDFEGELADNRTIAEEIVRIPPQRAQTLPGINYSPMRSNQLPPNFYQRGPQALGYSNLPPNYVPYQQFLPPNRYPSLPQTFNSNTRQIQPSSLGRPAPPFEPQMQPRGQGPPPPFPNTNTREIVMDSPEHQDQAFQPPMKQPSQGPLETFSNTNTREITSDTVVSPGSVLEPRTQQTPQFPPFTNTNVQDIGTESLVTPPSVFGPPMTQPTQVEQQPFLGSNTEQIVADSLVTPPPGFQPLLQQSHQDPVPPFRKTNVQESVTETLATPPPYFEAPAQQPPQDFQPQPFFNKNTQEIVTESSVTPPSGLQTPSQAPVPSFPNTNVQETATETVITPPPYFQLPVQQPPQAQLPTPTSTNTQEVVTDSFVSQPSGHPFPVPRPPQGPPTQRFINTDTQQTVTETLVSPSPVFQPPIRQQPLGLPAPLFSNTTVQETVTETFVTPPPFFQPPLQQRPQGPPTQPFLNTNTQESVTETFVVPNPNFQTPMQLQPQGPPPSVFPNIKTQETVTETLVTPPLGFQSPTQQASQGPVPPFPNTNRQESVTEAVVTPLPFFEPPAQHPVQGPIASFPDANTRETVTDIAISPIPEQLPQGPVPPFSKTNVQEIVTDSLVAPPPVFGPTMPQAPIEPQSEQPPFPGTDRPLTRIPPPVFGPPTQQPTQGEQLPFPGTNTENIQTDTLVSPPPGFQPPMQQSSLSPPVSSSSNTNAQETVTEILVTPPPLFEPRRGQFPPPTSTDIQELVTDSFVNSPSGFQSQVPQPPKGPPPQPYFNKITEEIVTESSVSPAPIPELPMLQPTPAPVPPFSNTPTREIFSDSLVRQDGVFEPRVQQPPQIQLPPPTSANIRELVTDTFAGSAPGFQSPLAQTPQGPPPQPYNTSTQEIVAETLVSPPSEFQTPIQQPPLSSLVPPFSNTNMQETVTETIVTPPPYLEPPAQQPPQGQLPPRTSTNNQEVETDTFDNPPAGFPSPDSQSPQDPSMQPFLNTNTQETLTETFVDQNPGFQPPVQQPPQGPPTQPFLTTNTQETVTETLISPPSGFQPPIQQPSLSPPVPPFPDTNVQEPVTETFVTPSPFFQPPLQQRPQGPPTQPFLNTNAQESITETFVVPNPNFQTPMQVPPQGPPPSVFSNIKTRETVTETLVTPPSGFQSPTQQASQSAAPPFPNIQETVTEAVVTPPPFFEQNPPVQKPPQAPLAPFTDTNTKEIVTDTLISPNPAFRPPPQQPPQGPVVPFSNTNTQQVVIETFGSPSPGFQSPVQPIPQVQQPLTSTNTQEVVTDTVVSPTSDFQPSLQQSALTTANTREIETDSLVSPLPVPDVSAGSSNSAGQTQTQSFEIVSTDAQNLYPGNKVTKLVKETITTDLPLGVTYSPIEDQLAFAETLLDSSAPVVESNAIVTTPSPEVEIGLNPSSDQIPFYDDKKVLEGQYSESVPPPSFNGNLPIRPEVQPVQGQSVMETKPPFADQVPSIQQFKETVTGYDEVVPPNMNRQTDSPQFDNRSGYGPQPPLANQAVMGPPMGYSQNVPYGFPPQHLPSFTPIAEQQHSNPLLQTLEHSHLTFPLHEPSEPPTSSPGPRGPSPLPLIQGSFTPPDPKTEIRGASAPSTNWDFVNPQSAQPSAGIDTAREVMISPQPDSRVLVSDQNDPSNGPGEDYVSCCERCRRGQTPLSCPFDPIYKGNMTAPSYYILITKLPVGEDEEEQFKVEKVYLGDGTPLNCTVNAGQTFPTSSYTPIPHRADGTVTLPTKSDFA